MFKNTGPFVTFVASFQVFHDMRRCKFYKNYTSKEL